MISMLGNAKGDGPGGFLLLNDKFEPTGRWEKDANGMNFNYDFWYQPRHNVMVSSEWAAPKTFQPGPNFDDVKAGKYGQQDSRLGLERAEDARQSIDLGDRRRFRSRCGLPTTRRRRSGSSARR